MGGIKSHVVSVRDVAAGDDVTIVEPTNLYECTLGEGVFVGPFCEVQRGVIIGAGTRVQSHSFICELVTIGDDCFVGHGVMFVNDRFAGGGPARGDTSKWETTTIGNRVSIGSNSTIMPVTVCDDVVIGAGSVITKNISQPGVYAGNPARLLRAHD
jgi:acetyltransferase-like isoleucine patch superfamily enzyme